MKRHESAHAPILRPWAEFECGACAVFGSARVELHRPDARGRSAAGFLWLARRSFPLQAR
jgi:hypothetical protein